MFENNEVKKRKKKETFAVVVVVGVGVQKNTNFREALICI